MCGLQPRENILYGRLACDAIAVGGFTVHPGSVKKKRAGVLAKPESRMARERVRRRLSPWELHVSKAEGSASEKGKAGTAWRGPLGENHFSFKKCKFSAG